MGWLVLLEPQDFSLETVEEYGDSLQVLYSSKPIDSAIEKLRERSTLCEQLDGESWVQGKEQFEKFLAAHRGRFVHVGYAGLMDDESPAIGQRQFYIERINNIKLPVTTERKTLFGKKKEILAEHWELLVPADYKPGVVLPCWAWFGSPPGNRKTGCSQGSTNEVPN